jgi:hypothetical protein
LIATSACATDEETRNILKQGLLGAGTGAIASGASGGNAGTGALIGAGTGVIGGALLDAITEPSPRYSRSAPPPAQGQYYDDQYDDGGEYYYEEPPQQSAASNVLKQGLLGAGTGAIAAGASGGDAGKGALIGAGTGAIGGILLDAISQPSQPRRVYRRPAQQQAYPTTYPQQQPQQARQQVYTTPATDEGTSGAPGTRKKVVRKYDDTGKVVSEEEIYY